MKSIQRQSQSVQNRRSFLGGLAATVVSAAPVYSKTAGHLKGAGDFRQISFISAHTGERLNSIYWIEGEYIREAVKEINFIMRDWRTSDVKAIDLRTIDLISASAMQLDVDEPFTLLSGYRSPKTNAMLRRRSVGAAKNSLHMRGQAVDLTLRTRTVSEIFKAALACRGGGVGKYTKSNFVHIDCGKVRSWGS